MCINKNKFKKKTALYRTTYQSYFRQLLKDATSEMLTLTSLVLELHSTVNTLRFFGPYLWGKLRAADRGRSSLSIKEK